MTIHFSIDANSDISCDLDRIVAHKHQSDDVLLRFMQALARQAAVENHQRAITALAAALNDQGMTS